MTTAMTRRLRVELLLLTVVAAIAAATLPLHAGSLGWSWDALNHHIYLGLMAESPRFDRDVIAASYQSYQYPYLYWPVYRLSLLDGPGAVVGAGWAALQAALLLPPVWLISLRLLPVREQALIGMAERVTACGLAFMSTVVLAGLETTANDLLAAVPLLWAFAVMAGEPNTDRHALVAAALWGVSAAFKLSNALFLPLLLLWWWMPGHGRASLRRGVSIGAGAVSGFGAAYAPWGCQLWTHMGNPFYPYFTSLLGTATGG
ncbi:MAG: hypothetical protein U5L05_19270 [Rubrivivax sp.]|nr:hypothetical protein [Rubrivivax sp.]